VPAGISAGLEPSAFLPDHRRCEAVCPEFLSR